MAHEGTPSVCNRQTVRVYVVHSADTARCVLAHQNGNRGFAHQVQAVFIVASNLQHFREPRERNQPYVDDGMFAQSLLYALHSLGVASCPLNWSATHAQDNALRQEFDIAPSDVTITMIAVGNYQDSFSYALSPRKDSSEIFIGEHLFSN
jgi:nitroreductase